MPEEAFAQGVGNSGRIAHAPAPPSALPQMLIPVQTADFTLPHYPFQPLPAPNGPAPYRFALSELLRAADVAEIEKSGTMVVHTVGDTGDYRGQQQDFVAAMMTADAEALPAGRKPAFFYHLGDVIYFAGDIDKYGDNFYATYQYYPGFIVAIPGNHDCQPDDPQDGPVDPNKVPLDGWVKNFMSQDATTPGSLKTGAARTQMDLPNVYWTFTTPVATFIGLFSNVGESQGEFHQDQIDWFRAELAAADADLALIVAVHHPPFSGDTEHSGSSVVYQVLFDAFAATGRYPTLVLSGHVHNYQRFTHEVSAKQIPCIVAGAGGYTHLGRLHKLRGGYPNAPLKLGTGLTLEQYDQDDFGFLRLEITKEKVTGRYFAAPYQAGATPVGNAIDAFEIAVNGFKVSTISTGG
jgi:hypothetical protein